MTATTDSALTMEEFLGTKRRFGEPLAAGETLNDDGAPCYGLVDLGSFAWDTLLHPTATRSPARAGTSTFFDSFELFQRNSRMQGPVWLLIPRRRH